MSTTQSDRWANIPVLSCIDCGTTGGGCRKPSPRPIRINGRCKVCYERNRTRNAPRRTRDSIKPCLNCGIMDGPVMTPTKYSEKLPFRSKDGLCLSCKNGQLSRQRAKSKKVYPCKTCGTMGGRAKGKHGVPSRIGGDCVNCYQKKQKRAQRRLKNKFRERDQIQIRIKLEASRQKTDYFKAKVKAHFTLAQQVVAEYNRATSWWGKASEIFVPKVYDGEEVAVRQEPLMDAELKKRRKLA